MKRSLVVCIILLLTVIVGCDRYKVKNNYEKAFVVNIKTVTLTFSLVNPDNVGDFPTYSATVVSTENVSVQVGYGTSGNHLVFGDVLEPNKEMDFEITLYRGNGWIKVYDKDGKFTTFREFNASQMVKK